MDKILDTRGFVGCESQADMNLLKRAAEGEWSTVEELLAKFFAEAGGRSGQTAETSQQTVALSQIRLNDTQSEGKDGGEDIRGGSDDEKSGEVYKTAQTESHEVQAGEGDGSEWGVGPEDAGKVDEDTTAVQCGSSSVTASPTPFNTRLPSTTASPPTQNAEEQPHSTSSGAQAARVFSPTRPGTKRARDDDDDVPDNNKRARDADQSFDSLFGDDDEEEVDPVELFLDPSVYDEPQHGTGDTSTQSSANTSTGINSNESPTSKAAATTTDMAAPVSAIASERSASSSCELALPNSAASVSLPSLTSQFKKTTAVLSPVASISPKENIWGLTLPTEIRSAAGGLALPSALVIEKEKENTQSVGEPAVPLPTTNPVDEQETPERSATPSAEGSEEETPAPHTVAPNTAGDSAAATVGHASSLPAAPNIANMSQAEITASLREICRQKGISLSSVNDLKFPRLGINQPMSYLQSQPLGGEMSTTHLKSITSGAGVAPAGEFSYRSTKPSRKGKKAVPKEITDNVYAPRSYYREHTNYAASSGSPTPEPRVHTPTTQYMQPALVPPHPAPFVNGQHNIGYPFPALPAPFINGQSSVAAPSVVFPPPMSPFLGQQYGFEPNGIPNANVPGGAIHNSRGPFDFDGLHNMSGNRNIDTSQTSLNDLLAIGNQNRPIMASPYPIRPWDTASLTSSAGNTPSAFSPAATGLDTGTTTPACAPSPAPGPSAVSAPIPSAAPPAPAQRPTRVLRGVARAGVLLQSESKVRAHLAHCKEEVEKALGIHRANCHRQRDEDMITCLWTVTGGTPCYTQCQGTDVFLYHCKEAHGVNPSKYAEGTTYCWSAGCGEKLVEGSLRRHLAEAVVHGRRKRKS